MNCFDMGFYHSQKGTYGHFKGTLGIFHLFSVQERSWLGSLLTFLKFSFEHLSQSRNPGFSFHASPGYFSTVEGGMPTMACTSSGVYPSKLWMSQMNL